MLVGVVIADTWDKIHQQVQALPTDIGMIELRLDAIDVLDSDEVVAQCQSISHPMIMTYRRVVDGGLYEGDESARLSMLMACLQANPAYVDIEHDVDHVWLDNIRTLYPNVSIIHSYHNLTDTPERLDAVIDDLYHPNVDVYKVVTTARSSLDGLRLLRVMQQQRVSWCGHCMGEEGQFTRFLSPVVGGLWSYVNVSDDDGGVGLPGVDTYRQYRHEAINTDTAVYALIGDPVSHSQGDRFHNDFFSEHDCNAAYVKIRCTQTQLPALFDEMGSLPIQGLSVTMPLKTSIMAHGLCQTSLMSINTLKRVGHQWEAINTDGDGVCDALQPHGSLQQQRVLLLGTGGTAIGIAGALLARGAKVTVANRSMSSLQALKQQHPVNCMPWDAIDVSDMDIIISALPIVAYENLTWLHSWSDHIQSHHLVMDVNYGQGKTLLCQLAENVGAMFVGGESMFVCQAQRQQRYWMS